MKSIFIYSKVHSYYAMSYQLLSHKYNVNYFQYTTNKINTLLKHKKYHYTSLFKESLIYSDVSEYVNEYYSLKESIDIIKKVNIHERKLPEKTFVSGIVMKVMMKRVRYKKRATCSFIKNNKNKEKCLKYSNILPLNMDKELKTNINSNNYISTITENTIYNNNDISFSIDLNINKNYDYNIINKYNDFINTSVSSLNSIINNINGVNTSKSTNKNKRNANTIRKRNNKINSYFPTSNYTKAICFYSNQSSKLQKQTSKQQNNKFQININETHFKNKIKSRRCHTNNNDNTNKIANTVHSIVNKNISPCQSQYNLQFHPTCTSTPTKRRIPSVNSAYSYATVKGKEITKGINYRSKILKKTKEKSYNINTNIHVHKNLFLTSYNGFGVKKDNKHLNGGKNSMYLSKFGFKITKNLKTGEKDLSPLSK